MRRCVLLLAWLIANGWPAMAGAAEPRPLLAVSSDFAGGSGEVLSLDQTARTIRLRPARHKDRGWDCWWYVQVTGIVPGETLALTVGNAPWATPDRAAFSLDGRTWSQTEAGTRTGGEITYRLAVPGSKCWFAWGPPFVPADAQTLVETAAKQCPAAKAFELCRSRGGRAVPALEIREASDVAAGQRMGIWIQARQHAWEAGSSWVCRGLVEWLVSDDDRAARLRKSSQIYVVPIMDVDNVAIGAGGKEEQPQDHNRDWSDDPHWPAVRAAQQHIRRMHDGGTFALFIDLHNPDAGARQPFYYCPPRTELKPRQAAAFDRFVAISQLEMTGPLVYQGQVRESGEGYDKRWRQISKNWVSQHTGEHAVALTLETAWNTPASTTEGYRTLGRQLGRSIERFFRTAEAE